MNQHRNMSTGLSSSLALRLDRRQETLGRYVLHRLRQVVGLANGDAQTCRIRERLERARCLESLRPLASMTAETLGAETLECLNAVLHDVQHFVLFPLELQERMTRLMLAMARQVIKMTHLLEAMPNPIPTV